MPEIILFTEINAPIERVFDLARCIDLHVKSTTGTREEAIAGRTSGLMEIHETVTWKARHFGITQKLTVRMTNYQKPDFFIDEMTKGAFKSMQHLHSFSSINTYTIMKDEFIYVAPLGIIGKIADTLFLKKYMTNFLINKNKE